MLQYPMQFVLINLQTTEVNIVSHLQLQKKLMVLKRRCWHFALLWLKKKKRFNKCIYLEHCTEDGMSDTKTWLEIKWTKNVKNFLLELLIQVIL